MIIQDLELTNLNPKAISKVLNNIDKVCSIRLLITSIAT